MICLLVNIYEFQSLKQDFRFEIIKNSRNKATILCPCKTCSVHLSASKKAYPPHYKKKGNGPQKHGNERWHISAIRNHLLQFHKKVQDIEIYDGHSQLSQSTLQRDAIPSTEQIEGSDDDFMGFESTSNTGNSQQPPKRRVREVHDSPVPPAKRTRNYERKRNYV